MRHPNSGRVVFVAAVVVMLIGALFLATPLAAQGMEKSNKAAKAKVFVAKSKMGSGPDANVKDNSDKNPADTAVKVAENKSPGAKTKGSGPIPCAYHVDNRTNLYIKIYLDRRFVGYVSPGGDGYGITGNGPTPVYGRADFTDGSYRQWVFDAVDCEGSQTWQLWP